MTATPRESATPIRETRLPVLRIGPSRGWSALNLGDLWTYRELLAILALRDVKLRYRQTALGVVWVILQPLVATVIFAVVFGRLARLPSDGLPYAVFAYCGLAGWNYFASVVTRGGNSLVGQANLITKVYFPRLLIPLSTSLSPLLDLAVALVLLAAMMAWYGIVPDARILLTPLFLALIMAAASGSALWLSALCVYYRDFHHTTPFLLQIWMYATPVVYSLRLIPERWRWVCAVNPMVAGVEGLRWSILGTEGLDAPTVLVASAVALVIFIGGLFFFRRVERSFADVI